MRAPLGAVLGHVVSSVVAGEDTQCAAADEGLPGFQARSVPNATKPALHTSGAAGFRVGHLIAPFEQLARWDRIPAIGGRHLGMSAPGCRARLTPSHS